MSRAVIFGVETRQGSLVNKRGQDSPRIHPHLLKVVIRSCWGRKRRL